MKRTAKLLSVFLALIMVIGTMTTFVFADSETPATDGQTQTQTQDQAQTTDQTQDQTQPAEDPDKEAIEKYGYYHGKDATKIPVLTYHMVVSNGKKASGKYRNSSLAVSRSTFDKQMKWLTWKVHIPRSGMFTVAAK